MSGEIQEIYSSSTVSVTYFVDTDEFVVREHVNATPEQVAVAWQQADLLGRWVVEQHLEDDEFVYLIGGKLQ